MQYNIRETTLSNGVRVVSVQLPHLNTAFVACYAAAGSIHETPLNNGISHFLEHVALRGGKHFPTYHDVDRAVEEIGGYAGASTSPDSTEFHVFLPAADRVGEAVRILGDVVSTPRLRESDIDIERRVIREEILEDKDNEFDIAAGLLWPKHPISMCMLGDESNVSKFGRSDLAEHHARFYVGSNTLICAVGNLEHRAVEEAASVFGDLEEGTKSHYQPVRSSQRTPKSRFLRRNYYQTEISLAFATLGFQDPLRPAFDLACDILAYQRTSRLMDDLVMKRGLVYSLDCRRGYHADSGLFRIKAQMHNSKAVRVLEGMLAEIQRLTRDGPKPQELAGMKVIHSGDAAFYLDNPDRMAEGAGRERLFTEGADPVREAERYKSVTQDEVTQAARMVFSPSRAALVAAGEFKKGQRKTMKALLSGWPS